MTQKPVQVDDDVLSTLHRARRSRARRLQAITRNEMPKTQPKPAQAKEIYWKARVDTKAAAQPEPQYWLFQKPGAAPTVGTGTAEEAAAFLQAVNQHSAVDPMTTRPATPAEAATLSATAIATPFVIASEAARFRGHARGVM